VLAFGGDTTCVRAAEDTEIDVGAGELRATDLAGLTDPAGFGVALMGLEARSGDGAALATGVRGMACAAKANRLDACMGATE